MKSLDTNPSNAQESNEKNSSNSQVLLPKTLVQRIKDTLKQLKKDTGADYSMVRFLGRVIEKHWMDEMEQLRKGLEKLKWNKE